MGASGCIVSGLYSPRSPGTHVVGVWGVGFGV